MQRLASKLNGINIYSVQATGKIAEVSQILLRQSDLKMQLLQAKVPAMKQPQYLLPSDIRFESTAKIIIDSHQGLSDAEELVRHQETINSPFNLIGCQVITQSGKKLGKVHDYSIENQHFYVAKLYVTAPFWQRFVHDTLLIDRSDIVDIERNKITVKDSFAKSKQTVTKALPVAK